MQLIHDAFRCLMWLVILLFCLFILFIPRCLLLWADGGGDEDTRRLVLILDTLKKKIYIATKQSKNVNS